MLTLLAHQLWEGKDPTGNDTMEGLIDDDDYAGAINHLREALAIINYLNNPAINGHMATALNEVRRELGRANDAWMAMGNPDEHAQRVWSYWVRDHLTTVGVRTQHWVGRWAREIDLHWGARSGTLAAQVLEADNRMRNANTKINMDDVD